ncbi:MAG: hypothetical protein ABMA13_23075 [Chthoniobacteraceae bacterium]
MLPSTTHTNSAAALADDDNPPIIDITDEQREDALGSFFAEQRTLMSERRAAVVAAQPALERLCEMLSGRSGQPYKVRALLYSLWNGQAVSLSETLGLDWAIKKDLCSVILAFGFDDANPFVAGCTGAEFFYDAIRDALKRAGQFEWFLEAHAESEVAL